MKKNIGTITKKKYLFDKSTELEDILKNKGHTPASTISGRHYPWIGGLLQSRDLDMRYHGHFFNGRQKFRAFEKRILKERNLKCIFFLCIIYFIISVITKKTPRVFHTPRRITKRLIA